MIDYLKLESELKPFGWKEWKEYENFQDKCLAIFFLALMFVGIIIVFWFAIFDKSENQGKALGKVILFLVLSILILSPILFFSEWKFKNKKIHIEYDNFETEENLKKVSYYGIENVNNFRNNIKILEEKTEYMVFENFQEKEKYINKLLNIFYIGKKEEKKNEESEILKLLKK